MVWSLDESWKKNDNVQGKFCKELMESPQCSVTVMAGIEVVRHSRRKLMWRAEKHSQRIVHMSIQYLARKCCEWQKGAGENGFGIRLAESATTS
jgi:hypothetical protein